MRPLVTIGIPTYARVEYLEQAVRSALAQTYSEIDVLIRDNGTTDAIQDLGHRLAREDGRVRFERNERNLGMAGNWNALADHARGDRLIILADDDRLLPMCVDALVDASPPEADIAFSNHYVIDATGARSDALTRLATTHYRRDELRGGRIDAPARCVWNNSIPICTALFNTETARRLRFKEDLNTPELELFARLAHDGGSFYFQADFLAEYRIHAGSATAQGLAVERLVKYLIPMPVPLDVEPTKRTLLESLLPGAVGRLLVQGDLAAAREYLACAYYPRRRGWDMRTWVQHAAARIPAPFGQHVSRVSGRVLRCVRALFGRL